MSYQPDNAGNRLWVTADGMATGYEPNSLNQYGIVGNIAVGNGTAHEIAAYQNVSYRYLGDLRLARASSSAAGTYEMGYDALGRCVRRARNGVATYYIYDGERPILELDVNGTVLARNTYGIGIDEILARDAGALHYHQDRLGNVSAVTDGAGQVVEQYRYDAFGAPEIRSGPVVGNPNGELTGSAQNNVTQVNNRFLFTGREWAAAYGFYEYRNRAYHPGLGRFMSEDPKGFAAGDRNLFRYCAGDPVNRVDPMGLEDDGYVHLSSAENRLLLQARANVEIPAMKIMQLPGGKSQQKPVTRMQAVLVRGEARKLSTIVSGTLERRDDTGPGAQQWVQKERLPVQEGWRAVVTTHKHWDRTGFGENNWSGPDRTEARKVSKPKRRGQSVHMCNILFLRTTRHSAHMHCLTPAPSVSALCLTPLSLLFAGGLPVDRDLLRGIVRPIRQLDAGEENLHPPPRGGFRDSGSSRILPSRIAHRV